MTSWNTSHLLKANISRKNARTGLVMGWLSLSLQGLQLWREGKEADFISATQGEVWSPCAPEVKTTRFCVEAVNGAGASKQYSSSKESLPLPPLLSKCAY